MLVSLFFEQFFYRGAYDAGYGQRVKGGFANLVFELEYKG